MGQTSEKTAVFQHWKEEGTALFKNMQWLLGRQSLSLKQARPHVWGIDSVKWGGGNFLKERKKAGDSIGRKDPAAVWPGEHMDSEHLVQHSPQCFFSTFASVVLGHAAS